MVGSRAERLAVKGAASRQISLIDDRRLTEIIESADSVQIGIGGATSVVEIGGVKIFVKKVPITDLELRPENYRSTTDHFGLPNVYHYGIGSTGFGAWRELAMHEMANEWIDEDAYSGVPLLYHWRVIDGLATGGRVFAEFDTLQSAVDYWDGSEAVRRRLDALHRSTASVVLFLEYIPWTLNTWLDEQRLDSVDRILRQLSEGSEFMRDRGVVHFDAHFDNILTDGHCLYVTDFGLAASSTFDLSADEATFVEKHREYDDHYMSTYLLNHLAHRLCNAVDGRGLIRDWVPGQRPAGLPASAAALFDEYAHPAACLNDFHHRLSKVSRGTFYPAVELMLLR